MAVLLRRAVAADGAFLADMLVEAANWHPLRRDCDRAETLAEPGTAHYVAGWPRPTDLGVIAAVGDRPVGAAGDRPVGAAWLRYFTEADPGYGFVHEDVPELTIGVTPGWRGRGVGRSLLRALADAARASGIDRVCLSVERANPATRLYSAEGYRVVDSGEHSDTMLLDLRRP